MQRNELNSYLDTFFDSARCKDYCPNGLQVEGRHEVRRIVCGVTASQALIEAAIEREADAVFVHHGYFWRGEDGRVTGTRKTRLQALLRHDINLFAYHLPLDLHPQIGNNVQLAKVLGWHIEGQCGEQNLVFLGRTDMPATAGQIAQEVAARLTRQPLLIGEPAKTVQRLAWCTGGAQSYFEQAIVQGVDIFISGEISEPTVHLARESGVAYLAAGHHATERYGIQALGEHLRERFGLQYEFVDIDNPV